MDRTIHVELTGDEVVALAKLVTQRMEYLTAQAPTPKVEQEMSLLAGYIHKVLPQISAHAQAERNERKAQSN